ncbi:HAMP domain-containing histidine kinase [Kitasatospora acidiphila]|uniref:histidine kinase n=2 Tax=Kitasatospora acidiphila TaxID=2567942 RepID=A0A540WET7_9ACTN|nr:HAMP domain-containing histidine kinase [Kitasatospora acidiphila]
MLAVVGLVAGGSVEAVSAPGSGGSAPSDAGARIASLEQQLAQARSGQTHQLLLGSAVGLAVMGLLSILLGWYAAGRVLRPLRAMTTATRRISADNLDERLAVEGPHDELRNLGDTIDGLLARLEGAFAAQRRFVADASHELRTPLATMRAAVDVTLAKPGPLPQQTLTLAGRVRTELDQVDRLLEGLLTLARAQHGVPPGTELVRLDALAAAALDQQAGSLAGRGLTATRAAHPGARVHGSRTLLCRLVENLVDNAVRHNEPEGWLNVTVHAGERTIHVTVENGGPVLAQAQAAELVRPFRRLGAERTGGDGSGLGLAIAAAVAEAHGGTLDLHARAEGGLRVTVTLPRADHEEARA